MLCRRMAHTRGGKIRDAICAGITFRTVSASLIGLDATAIELQLRKTMPGKFRLKTFGYGLSQTSGFRLDYIEHDTGSILIPKECRHV